MAHPLILTMHPGGSLSLIYHPVTHQSDLAAFSSLGTVTLDQRAGRVVPVSPVLRACFHLIRKGFGDTGKLAAWTRGWACQWEVVTDPPHQVPGTFPSHDAAVQAEVAWIVKNLQEGQL